MDKLFEVNMSSVSNPDPPLPPQPNTKMIVCALIHNGSFWNLFWDYFYRISIKPTWYRSPQAVGGCTAYFTTCWNVGQVTQPLFWVFFMAVFTTCQDAAWLHSHSSEFFLGCIYNLLKCWLVTQPLLQVFPSCIYNLPKCCLVTQPLFWVFSPLYLQPAKMLFDYTATLLRFCLVAFSYPWDIVWHLPNLSAASSPTHLPCGHTITLTPTPLLADWLSIQTCPVSCPINPHPTVGQLVVHSDLPCWLTHY